MTYYSGGGLSAFGRRRTSTLGATSAAAPFSAQWWNDQAAGGGLSKSAIEQLTGVGYATRWNPDGTVIEFWYNAVIARAPGFASAGLLLNPGSGQGSRDVQQAAATQDPNWGDWAYFTSPVGYVAPGATAPWSPTLTTTYVDPTNYLIQLQNYMVGASNMRAPYAAKVTELVKQLRAAGVAESWTIINVLQPWNAWDAAIANLADIVIPTEIRRVQQGGAVPVGADTSKYKPWPPPPLPTAIPAPGTPGTPVTVSPVPSGEGGVPVPSGPTSSLTPSDDPGTSAACAILGKGWAPVVINGRELCFNAKTGEYRTPSGESYTPPMVESTAPSASGGGLVFTSTGTKSKDPTQNTFQAGGAPAGGATNGGGTSTTGTTAQAGAGSLTPLLILGLLGAIVLAPKRKR